MKASKFLLVLLAAATLLAVKAGEASATNVATARALPNNTPVDIDNVVITSLTDSVQSGSTKSIYVQDATGGLTVFGSNAIIDALIAGLWRVTRSIFPAARSVRLTD